MLRINGMGRPLSVAAVLLLAGCAANSDEVASAPPPAETPRLCDAGPAQRHVGQTASEAMGAAILKDSGARTLRWGPPRSAWTMDYRQDRVNVRYDDAMKILDIICG
ncbi:MAG: I78 family peptidase inhibitor [Erythrobacter sp.]